MQFGEGLMNEFGVPEPGGTALKDNIPQIDMARLRNYRLARVQAELKKQNFAGCILFDPINVRYATGSRNMAVWMLHNPGRYAFVPAEGRATLFDFSSCMHLGGGLDTIDEVRPSRPFFFFIVGPRHGEIAKAWANEISDLINEKCGKNARIAIDNLNPEASRALEGHGITIGHGQEVLEYARAIKSPDEIACMLEAISVCETGMARMRQALQPGVTETQIWSLLHQANIENGGEWIETRLLSSGPRTNPWFQEASDRRIRPGELVAFDTDMIGPFGYIADLSRTYHCGPNKPTTEQKDIYKLAHEQVTHNMSLVKPGLGFREFAEQSWRIPDRYFKNRYISYVHGVGLCDEYPRIPYVKDFEASGYDGVFEKNMTVCIESYMGAEGAKEGVKLEQQILVTDKGAVSLSTFPFEEELLN